MVMKCSECNKLTRSEVALHIHMNKVHGIRFERKQSITVRIKKTYHSKIKKMATSNKTLGDIFRNFLEKYIHEDSKEFEYIFTSFTVDDDLYNKIKGMCGKNRKFKSVAHYIRYCLKKEFGE